MKTEFKGTQGKWEIVGHEPRFGTDNQVKIMSVQKGTRSLICSIRDFCLPRTEQLSNAKLIACAPEMLEMLSDLLHANEMNTIDYVNFESIRQLIKKATE